MQEGSWYLFDFIEPQNSAAKAVLTSRSKRMSVPVIVADRLME